MIKQVLIVITCIALAQTVPSKYPVASVDYANPFILGGENAMIEDYPFMCSLYNFNSFSCGCTILNKKFLLTAAHCSGQMMRYGVSNRTSNEAKEVNVGKCIRHPDYINFYHDDVMLCEVEGEIIFSDRVQPVKLPPPDFLVPGSWISTATAIGWGYDSDYSLPDTLQKVDFLVVSSIECAKIHENVADVTKKAYLWWCKKWWKR